MLLVLQEKIFKKNQMINLFQSAFVTFFILISFISDTELAVKGLTRMYKHMSVQGTLGTENFPADFT